MMRPCKQNHRHGNAVHIGGSEMGNGRYSRLDFVFF